MVQRMGCRNPLHDAIPVALSTLSENPHARPCSASPHHASVLDSGHEWCALMFVEMGWSDCQYCVWRSTNRPRFGELIQAARPAKSLRFGCGDEGLIKRRSSAASMFISWPSYYCT